MPTPALLQFSSCVKQQNNNIFMFKGQSHAFSFKSHHKRQEKTTSKTKWHTCGECDRIATSRPRENPRRKCFSGRSVIFLTRRRSANDDQTKDIFSGATKANIRVINMGGMGNFCQHRIVFLALQSYIHSLIFFVMMRC